MEIFSAGADAAPMKKPKSNTDANALLSPEMRPDRVGIRVTAMREALKMSSAQIADSAGIDRSLWTRIEKGKEGLSIKNAVILSDLYGFGLNYIYRANINDVPLELRPEILNQLHRLRSLPSDLLGEPSQQT